MIKRLEELKIGDKFWLADVPYLVIDLDMKNMSLFTDFSDLRFVLSLVTYKVIGLSKNTKVTQERILL